MGDQTTWAMRRIGKVLDAHSSGATQVLSTTLFVTGMEQKPALNTAWAEWFGHGSEPARATVAVETMGALRLVEVCTIAAVDEPAASASPAAPKL
eukprot:SAG22_NODE_158_length_16966_cov_26.252446_4_plen_95_part_00